MKGKQDKKTNEERKENTEYKYIENTKHYDIRDGLIITKKY
jgi:hypothetical protein